MNTHAPDPISSAIVEKLQSSLHAGASLNDAVALLRTAGLDKIDSIKLLREKTGLTLAQAKAVVHLSPAWDDRYAADNRLHALAERALHSLA